MIRQAYIAGAAALLVATVAFTAGWRVNGWRLAAEQQRTESAAQKAATAATAAAVAAIEKIEVRNVTIRQQAETITREVPVYRECRHDPDGLRAINQALAGSDPGPVGLPTAGTADGR